MRDPKRERPERAAQRAPFGLPLSVFLIATAPGVLARLTAQQLFCRLLRVAIFEVHPFRLDGSDPAGGEIVHERPRRASQQALLVTGPFLISTVLGALVAAPATIPMVGFAEGGPLDYFFLVLGVAIAAQAFPAPGTVEAAREGLIAAPFKTHRRRVPKRRRFPLLRLIAFGAGAPFVWRKLLYGLLVALLVPAALIRLLAYLPAI